MKLDFEAVLVVIAVVTLVAGYLLIGYSLLMVRDPMLRYLFLGGYSLFTGIIIAGLLNDDRLKSILSKS